MKMLDKTAFAEIQAWQHRNARELELALWRYHFEQGSQEDVLRALAWYQNEDGGFGRALEPDCWNSASSPYTTSHALHILREIGFADSGHPLIQGVLSYLASGAHCLAEGWRFNIPSNDDYPRAPWWTFNDEMSTREGRGVTAQLCGFIFRHSEPEQPLYEKALGFVAGLLAKLADPAGVGETGAPGYLQLWADLAACGLAERYNLAALRPQLLALANAAIERDPANWVYYNMRPSDLIRSPESPLYAGNEQVVEQELDYLIESRQPGGVWPITWNWFDLMKDYARQFAVSERWWRGFHAVQKLCFLRAFGRLEG